jgi:hypothetical protein
MAKKKYTDENEPLVDLVSNEKTIIEDIIKPAVEEHWAEKVRTFRSQGYDDNRIAAMLMINVNKVKAIK